MVRPVLHASLPSSGWRDITALCTSDYADLFVRFRYDGGRCTLEVTATSPASPGLRIANMPSALNAFGWPGANRIRGFWGSDTSNANGQARSWDTGILLYGSIPASQRIQTTLEWWGPDVPPAWPGVAI